MDTKEYYVVPSSATQVIGALALIGAIAVGSMLTRGFMYIRDQYIADTTKKH